MLLLYIHFSTHLFIYYFAILALLEVLRNKMYVMLCYIRKLKELLLYNYLTMESYNYLYYQYKL